MKLLKRLKKYFNNRVDTKKKSNIFIAVEGFNDVLGYAVHLEHMMAYIAYHNLNVEVKEIAASETYIGYLYKTKTHFRL